MVTRQILDLHSEDIYKQNSKYKHILETVIDFILHLCPCRILHKNTPTVESMPRKIRVVVLRRFEASLGCT